MQSFRPKSLPKLRHAAIIVETEKKLLVPYSAALSQAGFAPEMIPITKRGFHQLLLSPPQLLVFDIDLPSSLGEQMLEAILKRKNFKNTTKFLLTSNDYYSRAYAKKVDLILDKPVQLKNLFSLSSRYYLMRSKLRNRVVPDMFDYQSMTSNYLSAH